MTHIRSYKQLQKHSWWVGYNYSVSISGGACTAGERLKNPSAPIAVGGSLAAAYICCYSYVIKNKNESPRRSTTCRKTRAFVTQCVAISKLAPELLPWRRGGGGLKVWSHQRSATKIIAGQRLGEISYKHWFSPI